jgi:hypothetical protein
MSIRAPFFCPYGDGGNLRRMGTKKSNDGPSGNGPVVRFVYAHM